MTQHNDLRKIALKIIDRAHSVGMKYVKHRTIATFFVHFFKPRMDKIILQEASIEDIRSVMWDMKRELDEAFKIFDIAQQIQEGEALGSIKIPNLGELKKIKDIAGINKKADELLKELKIAD